MEDEPRLRVATLADRASIDALMKESASVLFPRFYDASQASSAVRYVAAVDPQLLGDGTYFVLESRGELVGCGGWSRRDKLYTGSGEGADDARPLDPVREPARVRAMFVRADWTRRGLGRRILDACAAAAHEEGFVRLALMATLPGVPLYLDYGFLPLEDVEVRMPDGVTIPCTAMEMPLTSVAARLRADHRSANRLGLVTSRTRLWHPFAAMGKVDGHELVLARGEGSTVWDADGARVPRRDRRSLVRQRRPRPRRDRRRGRRAAPHARRAPRLRRPGERAGAAARRHASPSSLRSRIPRSSSARAAARRSTPRRRSSGATGRSLGRPERTVIVSRRFAYHGTNAYGTSLAGIPAVRDGFGPLVRDVAEVAHDDPDELARTLDELGERAAGFIGEPVIGAGGVIPPPDGYWPAVERICRERDVLLDRRRGDLRLRPARPLVRLRALRLHARPAHLREGHQLRLRAARRRRGERARPRAVLGRRRRAVPQRRNLRGAPGRLCRGARRTSTSSSASGWSSASQSSSPCSRRLLEPLRELRGVAEVRSAGLAAAVELDAELLAADPALVWKTVLAARAHGVLTRVLRGVALQISPPFVVTEDELAAMVERISAGLQDAVAA